MSNPRQYDESNCGFDITAAVLQSVASMDAEVVHVIILETKRGLHLCSITECMSSLEASEYTLEFVDEYIGDHIRKNSGLFPTTGTYQATVLQFLPKQKKIRRKLFGEIYIKVTTQAGP